MKRKKEREGGKEGKKEGREEGRKKITHPHLKTKTNKNVQIVLTKPFTKLTQNGS